MTRTAGRNGKTKHGAAFAARILGWYDRHARALPWRAPPGQKADPYMVWLSEIMLQQTVVAAVKPYFDKFTKAWPTVHALARADRDDVLAAWAGLGYYSRARHLHACANIIAAEHGGRFPDREEDLRQLPGIGPYTAAAVAAIAFGRRANAVDGNIERIIARYYAVGEPLPKAKPLLRTFADGLLPRRRCGDYIQGLMDLGAAICTPKAPKCPSCPVRTGCKARRLGIAADLPVKAPRKAKPVRRGAAFYAERPDGAVLLRRRDDRGLLGGMMEVPSSPWVSGSLPEDVLDHVPLAADWVKQPGVVRHTFTHFHLELEVFTARTSQKTRADGEWASRDSLGACALPTVMRKVISHAVAALTGQM